MKQSLDKPALAFLKPSEIKLSGYMRKRLEVQAAGLAGNLHKFWPDVADSKWIGGGRDGWERVPYWLDGFIPLAYLLDDAERKATAKMYIDGILARQKPDGWLCPCDDNDRGRYDVWAYFLICKVLCLYADCASDTRIEGAVYDALYCLNKHLDRFTLFDWAQARWYECLIPVYWLLERRQAPWLYELIVKLKAQGYDYALGYENWAYEHAAAPREWTQMSHVVNNAMMLKGDALYSLYSGKKSHRETARKMLAMLDRFHGTPAGVFNGDECLAGKSPVRGAELCSVVELMYSCEQLLHVTGDPFWADRLEKIAFNALPATLTPDMWAHQYDQQLNQVMCVKMPDEKSVFSSNNGESNLFGLEPNFGCCTANFGQAYPKYVLSSVYRTPEGLAVAMLSPVLVETSAGGGKVRLEVAGDYPFDDRARIVIDTERPFPLRVRIPAWGKATLTVNGNTAAVTSGFAVVDLSAGHTEIEVGMKAEIRLINCWGGLKAVERGALLYSLKIDEAFTRINTDVAGREYPHCDYEVHPVSDYAFALASDAFRYEYRAIEACPYDPQTAPNRIYAQCRAVDWPIEDGHLAPLPAGRPKGAVVEKIFVPYGATCLRLTALPLYREKQSKSDRTKE